VASKLKPGTKNHLKVARGVRLLVRWAVRRIRDFIWYWAPVLLCLALIFGGSGDQASGKRTSRIIGPFLHWLFPEISPKTQREVEFAIRKCAHLTEYAIFALLFWRARVKPRRSAPVLWQWRWCAETLWATSLYAATDEFHQTFVPTREGCVRDVGIDLLGAMAAMALLWLATRRGRPPR
jgi:VanZ family protein